METILKKLSDEDWKILHGQCLGTYLEGCCYELAIALSRGTGWQMIGIMRGEIIRHVVVKDSAGLYHDARGVVSEEKLGEPFGLFTPYDLKPVSEDDLAHVRPIGKGFRLERASLIAETLWPEYPWNENCFRSRALAFLDDLGELCMKHAVWIRAFDENKPIILDRMTGEEGFCITPLLTGQYLFDRHLES